MQLAANTLEGNLTQLKTMLDRCCQQQDPQAAAAVVQNAVIHVHQRLLRDEKDVAYYHYQFFKLLKRCFAPLTNMDMARYLLRVDSTNQSNPVKTLAENIGNKMKMGLCYDEKPLLYLLPRLGYSALYHIIVIQYLLHDELVETVVRQLMAEILAALQGFFYDPVAVRVPATLNEVIIAARLANEREAQEAVVVVGQRDLAPRVGMAGGRFLIGEAQLAQYVWFCFQFSRLHFILDNPPPFSSL